MSQDDTDRLRDTEGTETSTAGETMHMADPDQIEEAVADGWGPNGDEYETTSKSLQDEGEDLIDGMFRPDGKLRKHATTEDSEGEGVFSEVDMERARDQNKSEREVLHEIRDELRGRNGTGRGPAGGARTGKSTVHKSDVVLKEEDVEALLEEFREDTGVSLADERGVAKFYDWLADRVFGDGPGGGPREEKIFEEIDERFDELTEQVREAVAAAEDGTA